jgi:hypothetical protein
MDIKCIYFLAKLCKVTVVIREGIVTKYEIIYQITGIRLWKAFERGCAPRHPGTI